MQIILKGSLHVPKTEGKILWKYWRCFLCCISALETGGETAKQRASLQEDTDGHEDKRKHCLLNELFLVMLNQTAVRQLERYFNILNEQGKQSLPVEI